MISARPVGPSCAFSVLIFVGTSCGRYEPSEVDLAEIARLDSVRQEIAVEVAAARDVAAEWQRGLIGSFARARLEVLETTDAMLQQRIEGLRTGSGFSYTLTTMAPDSVRAASLEEEIQAKRVDLQVAERKAQRYSGGLLEALALAEAATVRQTIAMLELQKLAAVYGLTLPRIDSAETVESLPLSTGNDISDGRPRPAPARKASFEILSIDTRVTERNVVYWRYAWRLTVKNLGEQSLTLDATIEFQDSDGFIIDEDTEYNLRLAGGAEETFTGYALVDADVARNVDRVSAKVRGSS